MGLFKKLFGTVVVASVAAGGYYLYKNKDKIERSIKAKKQNISLDLEVFNQTHADYQTALDEQSKLEEEMKYYNEYSNYYTLLKESYVRVQHDILNAKAHENQESVTELENLKATIQNELAEGVNEFEKVTSELEARKEEVAAVNDNVENCRKLYEVAKENIQAYGRKYLKGISDPVKQAVESTFKTIDLPTEEIEETVHEKVEEVVEAVEEKASPLNNAIDKTQESINRLLNTINK